MNEGLDPTLEQPPPDDPKRRRPRDPRIEPTTPLPPDHQAPAGGLAAAGLGDDVPQIPDVTLVSVIGRGGMGVVYRGRQTYLERDVAVKLLGSSADSGNFAARFQREAKLLAGMMHSNIVACFSAGTANSGHCYIVMEFIDGPDLGHWVREHGPLPARDALGVCRDLATALAHGHQLGIIHRDVKPANVLLQPRSRAAPDDFPFVVKLADLGLARSETRSPDQPEITMAGSILGTPSTMAPEQFDDPDSVDFRADIYGLGCVLYYVLTAQPAFPNAGLTTTIARKQAPVGPDPRQVCADVPEGVAKLVTEMLAADREDRPASYAALQQRCDELIRALGPEPRVDHRRSSVSKVAGAAVGAAVLAFGAWAFLRERGPGLEILTSPEEVREGVEVRLLAGVQDPELSYRWRQLVEGTEPVVDLATPNSREASFVAPEAAGPYALTFELNVSRKAGADPATRTVRLEIAASDDPPVVSVAQPTTVDEGQTVQLVAHARDPEGGLLEVLWTQDVQGTEPTLVIANPTTREPSIEIPQALEGYVLHLVLTVRDEAGHETRHPVDLTVTADDDPPQLVVDGPTDVVEDSSVVLTASAIDPEGAPTTLSWRQVMGRPVALPTAESAVNPGSLEFRAPFVVVAARIVIEVTASDGQRSTAVTRELRVRPRAMPLSRGQKVPLLTGEMGTRLARWRPLHQTGTWGDSIFASHDGVTGRDTAGVTAQALALPPGDWTLRGQLEPIVDETGKVLELAAVRLLIAKDEAIAFEIARAASGHVARVRRLRQQEDGAWLAYVQPSTCPETPGVWNEEDPLVFRVVHAAGRSIEFRWGAPNEPEPLGTCEVSLEAYQRAFQLDLVVDRGFACFCGFSLTGDGPR